MSNFNVGGTFIVNSLEDIIDSDDGVTTLREAIDDANNHSGQDTIVFNLATGSEIELTKQLNIKDDLFINGLGAENLTVSGDNTFNNFFIDDTNVVLDGLTIANGRNGIKVGSDSTLTVTNSALSNNAEDGIDVNEDGNTVTVSNTSFRNNMGDGFDVNGDRNSVSLFAITSRGNDEDGVEVTGDRNIFTASDSTFSNNESDGVDVNGDRNTATLSAITSRGNGEDGVEVNGDRNTLTVSDSTFSNNEGEAIADRGNRNTVNVSDGTDLPSVIPIENPGFEDLDLNNNQSSSTVFRVNIRGDNNTVNLSANTSISNSNTVNVSDGNDLPIVTPTEYTLQVEVGNPADEPDTVLDFVGFPNYQVELLAGDSVPAVDDNTLNIEEGTFETSEVTFVASDDSSYLGQGLGIRLINPLEGTGQAVDFDNVRLTATALGQNQLLSGGMI